MTLIKKTTKTLVLGVALLGLAVGASSWASARTERDADTVAPARFFNTSGNPASTNPADYVYDDNGECSEEGAACSALWDHTGALTNGMSPNGAKLEPDEPGTYIPSN
jgi:hypothetical protein